MAKNPTANAGDVRDPGSIPGWERSGEGSGNPLQDSCLEYPMDRGAWQATVQAPLSMGYSRQESWSGLQEIAGTPFLHPISPRPASVTLWAAPHTLSSLLYQSHISLANQALFITARSAKSIHLCLTLCNPMDCSPPGSSVHKILRARILERIAIPFPRRSS